METKVSAAYALLRSLGSISHRPSQKSVQEVCRWNRVITA